MKLSAGSSSIGGPLCLYDDESGEAIAMMSTRIKNKEAIALAIVGAVNVTWQPIETAPKDGARILASDGCSFATTEFINGRWIASPTAWEGSDERGGLADLEFTPPHWMIPEPPK